MKINTYLIGFRYDGSNYKQAIVLAETEMNAINFLRKEYNDNGGNLVNISTVIILLYNSVFVVS